MMHLDFRDARPIYLQITDSFRTQIRTGILKQDEQLPSVRELAAELSINPNTIQRSYRQLESEGYIVTIPGKGCFVKAVKDAHPELWRDFDAAAGRLMDSGITQQQLLEHLIKGGKFHAPNA